MDQINSKQDLISFFEKGCKKKNQLGIGVEHEKFVFEKNSNKRINFETASKVFDFFLQFGWKPIKEKNNVVGLSKDGKSISSSPIIFYVFKIPYRSRLTGHKSNCFTNIQSTSPSKCNYSIMISFFKFFNSFRNI